MVQCETDFATSVHQVSYHCVGCVTSVTATTEPPTASSENLHQNIQIYNNVARAHKNG